MVLGAAILGLLSFRPKTVGELLKSQRAETEGENSGYLEPMTLCPIIQVLFLAGKVKQLSLTHTSLHLEVRSFQYIGQVAFALPPNQLHSSL